MFDLCCCFTVSKNAIAMRVTSGSYFESSVVFSYKIKFPSCTRTANWTWPFSIQQQTGQRSWVWAFEANSRTLVHENVIRSCCDSHVVSVSLLSLLIASSQQSVFHANRSACLKHQNDLSRNIPVDLQRTRVGTCEEFFLSVVSHLCHLTSFDACEA